MSTILKALKQIDQTTPPEDLQSWPPKIDTKGTVKTRVQKIRLNRKVYLAAVLTLIIVAIGWLAFANKQTGAAPRLQVGAIEQLVGQCWAAQA